MTEPLRSDELIQSLSDFTKDLSRHRRDFEDWSRKQGQDLEGIRQGHKARLKQEQDEILGIVDDEKHMQIEASKLREVLEKESREVNAQRLALTQLTLQERESSKEVSKLERNLQDAVERLESRQASIIAEEKKKREQRLDLERGVNFFRDRLGLDFERLGNNLLRVMFTLVDPTRPDRKFFFTLRLDESGEYTITECRPPVDDAAALIQRLNKSDSDFDRFIQTMRKRFRAIVEHEAVAAASSSSFLGK